MRNILFDRYDKNLENVYKLQKVKKHLRLLFDVLNCRSIISYIRTTNFQQQSICCYIMALSQHSVRYT
jgi:hypothetical protein